MNNADVFEVICFNTALSDMQIQNIYDLLVKYYPLA